MAIVALIIFRDDLRARLRQARPYGVPLLTEAATMIASYLTAERGLGRIAADADVDALAPTLIGAGHLLFAGREGVPPDAGRRPQGRHHGHGRRADPAVWQLGRPPVTEPAPGASSSENLTSPSPGTASSKT